MTSLNIVVTSQIKLIPTRWLVYFVLNSQPFFLNFGDNQAIDQMKHPPKCFAFKPPLNPLCAC
jgi:hypothetical protein